MKMTRIVVIVVALIMITVSVVMKFSNEKARSNTKKRNASSPDWMCASTPSCIIEDYTSIPLSSIVDLEGYEVQRNIRWEHGYSRYVLLELVRTSPFQGMRCFVRLVALRKTAWQYGFEKIFDYEVSTYSEYPCWEVEQSELSWRNESGELQTILAK